MRTGYKVVAAGVAAMLGCAVAVFAPQGEVLLPEATAVASETSSVSHVITDSASTTYHDGTYRASARGKCGEVPVTVTVEGGVISGIVVGQSSEVEAMLDKAETEVIPQILATQSTEGIDAASGATVTSEAIVAAVSEALTRAAA